MYLPLALPMANETAAGAGSMLPMILMLVLVMGVFWFFSRSQRKRQQEQMSFRDRLQVGQQVQTIGMLIGEITWIDGDTLTIETTPGTSFKISRNGIRSLVEDEVPEVEEPDEADSQAVVSEAEAVVKEAGSDTTKAGKAAKQAADDAASEADETITLNGEEISREDLEGGNEGKKKKGKK